MISFNLLTNPRSTVVDTLRTETNTRNCNKVGVMFFYFDNSNQKNQGADEFVKVLLKQMIYQLPGIPDGLEKLYDLCLEQGNSAEPERAQLVTLLSDCFQKFDIVYVIIDAFDESPVDQRRGIMEDLHKLPDGQLRLFITSRPNVFESRSLRENSHLRPWLQESTSQEITARPEDIRKYLQETLNRKCPGIDKSIFDRIVAEISTQSREQSVFRNILF